MTTAAGEEDGVLISRAQAGDVEAFGRLVERHMRRAYYAALFLVGTREDALDLSQEAFARAFRARGSLDPARPFYAWHSRYIGAHEDEHVLERFAQELTHENHSHQGSGGNWPFPPVAALTRTIAYRTSSRPPATYYFAFL